MTYSKDLSPAVWSLHTVLPLGTVKMPYKLMCETERGSTITSAYYLDCVQLGQGCLDPDPFSESQTLRATELVSVNPVHLASSIAQLAKSKAALPSVCRQGIVGEWVENSAFSLYY